MKNVDIVFTKTSRKGISLITLVITIIVIIILAGTVILSLSNTNVVGSAQNAVNEQFKSSVIDSYNLRVISEISNDEPKNVTILDIANDLGINETDNRLTDYKIDENGNLTYKGQIISGSNENINLPVPESGTTFTDKDGKTVPVPLGFSVDTIFNVVSEGLVITDTSDDITTQGNQFVWVPVKDISTGFTRTAFQGETLSEISGTGNHYEQYSKTEGEYKAITDSIAKYGGFYVGRFEAGVASNMEQTSPASDTTEIYANGSYKPVSKKGVPVWSKIQFSTQGITDVTGIGNGAVKAAHSTYSNKNGVYSTLLYPQHFDTILNWMLETPVLKTANGIILNNKAVYKPDYIDYTDTSEVTNEILNNSSQWGNHSETSKYKNIIPVTCIGAYQKTGNSEEYSVKNIYDLAGNVYEWNLESYSSSRISVRGGSYSYDGNSYPVSRRYGHTPSGSYASYGFRLVLYIK